MHARDRMKTRKIVVLLAAPLPPPVGGIATWTTLILRVPADDDIDRIHVNTSVGGGYDPTRLSTRVAGQMRLAARVCWRILRDHPDVIHVPSSYARGWRRDTAFLGLARRLGAATIVNLRGGDFERIFLEATPRAQRAILAELRRCDAVVPITEETTRFLNGLGLTNVQMIPNCIDVRPRSPLPTRRVVRWLYVGHISAAKGLPELFEALRRFPDAHLTVVGPLIGARKGGGSEILAAAQSDAALRDRITHIGTLPPNEARDVYPNFDLFVFPTRREGFSNSLVEAMEAGLPIVATRVGAVPDMIVDGEHGLLAEPGDQAGLESAIAKITADPEFAARLGVAARARASSLYDVRRVSADWCELYRRLATSGERSRAD
jgi:glycosyltransferase involved in cell wall biosynthesis